MKIREINQIETRILEGLEHRFAGGDNQAGEIILKHLRKQSMLIDNWRTNKRKEEKENATTH